MNWIAWKMLVGDRAKYFGIVEAFEPHVEAYLERVTSRPAYKKAAGG